MNKGYNEKKGVGILYLQKGKSEFYMYFKREYVCVCVF